MTNTFSAENRSAINHQPINGSLFDNLDKDPHQLITAAQAALILSVSPKTVFFWAKARLIPCVRLGRLVRFRLVDIEAFIAGKRS